MGHARVFDRGIGRSRGPLASERRGRWASFAQARATTIAAVGGVQRATRPATNGRKKIALLRVARKKNSAGIAVRLTRATDSAASPVARPQRPEGDRRHGARSRPRGLPGRWAGDRRRRRAAAARRPRDHRRGDPRERWSQERRPQSRHASRIERLDAIYIGGGCDPSNAAAGIALFGSDDNRIVDSSTQLTDFGILPSRPRTAMPASTSPSEAPIPAWSATSRRSTDATGSTSTSPRARCRETPRTTTAISGSTRWPASRTGAATPRSATAIRCNASA